MNEDNKFHQEKGEAAPAACVGAVLLLILCIAVAVPVWVVWLGVVR